MILKVDNVTKSYAIQKGIFSKAKQEVLKGVSLNVQKAQCVGIVGESGSGKSTLGKLILGLEKVDSGNIIFSPNGESLISSKMSVVFQDYISSVNPLFRVLQIISEPLLQTKLSYAQKRQKVIEALKQVGLNESFISRYPHQLSGGQLQRVCIARAIITKPQFILLDEAISSLDASVQVQVLDLLLEIKQAQNISFVFITHDLLSATYICDSIVFFKDGRIVEKVDDMKNLKYIKEDYSKQLLNVYAKI